MKLERPCLIGVVHLGALPGSPGWNSDAGLESLAQRALADARTFQEAGFSAVVVENFGDTPFFAGQVPPETIASMARMGGSIREAVGTDFPVGFNVLRNDAASALGLCAAWEGSFIRVNVHTGAMVTDQGIIEGQAAETLRKRDSLGFSRAPLILADVLVKHAAPVGETPIAQAARDTFYRGRADGLIVTGAGTGEVTPIDRLRAVREAVPEAPLFAGSGVSVESVSATLEIADGVIVGSSLKIDGKVGNPVDPERANQFVAAARG